MDILKIIILSSSSLLVLFILAKIMGNKEISQLSTFDYIIGITIGSIAAEMSTALESDFICYDCIYFNYCSYFFY